MKRIYLLLLTSYFAFGVFAQSQRMVLAEEFTNASCGPCASQNPTFNSLLAANPTKVVAIKYQTNWPGVDPMNAQTQTDVGPRVTYYAVNGVPYSRIDGSEAPILLPNYAGAPANWTAAIINTEYAITSPFTLSVMHTMSSSYDSAFVTVVVTASQNFTSTGGLKLHLGMTEKMISFPTAPGSNGETDFENVMRKMYPSASGTTLGSTWTNGQTATFTYNLAVPSYIYDYSEINFVTFIQDDGDKSIKQAAGDATITIPNDAAVTAVSGIGGLNCTGNFIPVVTLENTGSVNMTSCTINSQVDAGAPVTFAWTGNLAPNASANVTLPGISATTGAHTFKAWPTLPNGVPISNSLFSQAAALQTVNFTVNLTAGVVLPLTNSFTVSTFPYAGWILNNSDAGITWARATTNSGSLKYDCFNYNAVGQIDEVIVQPVDLTSMINASLNFKVAHAQYNASYTDALEVLVSADCATTWNLVWSKSGATLATANSTTSAYVPSAAGWRAECIDLSAYAGNNTLYIMFRGINGFGNNIFVDEINISNAACQVGIQVNASINSINVVPNPFDVSTNVAINLDNTQEVAVDIYSLTGELISTTNFGVLAAGKQVISVNGTELADGMYFITVRAGTSIFTSKVSVVH